MLNGFTPRLVGVSATAFLPARMWSWVCHSISRMECSLWSRGFDSSTTCLRNAWSGGTCGVFSGEWASRTLCSTPICSFVSPTSRVLSIACDKLDGCVLPKKLSNSYFIIRTVKLAKPSSERWKAMMMFVKSNSELAGCSAWLVRARDIGNIATTSHTRRGEEHP